MPVAKKKEASPNADPKCIRLRNVRQNNLKGFDLDLPLGKLIAITGLSGSGKSSLAFETLYAEGQRRYIETFSPYARQFFDRMDKPAADRIENIPPAIAIEQRNSVRTTRSTVGTMTETCDHMKVLWTHLSRLYCRKCGRIVQRQPPQTVWEETVAAFESEPASKAASRVAEGVAATDGSSLRDAVIPYRVSGAATASPSSAGPEILVLFDLPLTDKLTLAEQLTLLQKQGFQRILVGDAVVRVDEASARKDIDGKLTVVADRVRLGAGQKRRFIEACEQAYHFGRGKLSVRRFVSGEAGDGRSALTLRFSSGFHCAECDLDYREPSSSLFSFNNPVGACPQCKGFGRIITIDLNLAVPDRTKTLAEGVVRPWLTGTGAESQNDLMRMARARRIPTDVPFNRLPADIQTFVIDGDPKYGTDEEHQWPKAWYGVKGYFRWLESKAYKMHVRVLLSRYRSYKTCGACEGRRFNADSLLFRLPLSPALAETLASQGVVGSTESLSLAQFYALPARTAHELITQLERGLGIRRSDPIGLVLAEIKSRLACLVEVGLGYLTLDRATRTLSGGETERVSLTTCLGTRLVNTLYILDEPTVGLHPRDTERLVKVISQLRDVGNTVVIVEHEAAVMRAADQIVDIGPGHGESGGRIVFQGPSTDLKNARESLTADYLTGRKRIAPLKRRAVRIQAKGFSAPATDCLRLEHARVHNLKDITIQVPLGRFVAITGVSGSGKTSLAREVLLPALQSRLGASAAASAAGEDENSEAAESGETSDATALHGWEKLGAVVLVDQSPLGRTPRSNPAVYISAFEDIRDFFARTPVAKESGVNASAFSFNSQSGQCEKCRGAGFEKVEMQFLSDIFIKCAECQGRRYRQHILDIKVSSPGTPSRDWSIADLLDATVEDAIAFLEQFSGSDPARRAARKLALLAEVGLGYLRVGQPINTLSGGESQRLKLVSHLASTAAVEQPKSRRSSAAKPTAPSKPTLFLFDEPTTGLHFDDVRVLLQVFQRLVDAGHSVLVIEHNLDVIKCADWLIDLGPDAGDDGGKLVAAGTPEDVARCAESHTGRFLKDVLGKFPLYAADGQL